MKSLEWQKSESKLAIYFALTVCIILLWTSAWSWGIAFSSGMIIQAVINYLDHKYGKDFFYSKEPQ